jgi:hypothetical protein
MRVVASPNLAVRKRAGANRPIGLVRQVLLPVFFAHRPICESTYRKKRIGRQRHIPNPDCSISVGGGEAGPVGTEGQSVTDSFVEGGEELSRGYIPQVNGAVLDGGEVIPVGTERDARVVVDETIDRFSRGRVPQAEG